MPSTKRLRAKKSSAQKTSVKKLGAKRLRAERLRLVVTGVPGVGKTALATELARKLGCDAIDASRFIEERRLYSSRLSTGELVVRMRAAEKALNKFLAGKKSFVAHGHVLCEFRLPCDLAVVLRCRPAVLWRRLLRRGYRGEKIRENLLAEALDYCLLKATANYPWVLQLDNTKPLSAAEALDRIAEGKSDFVDYSQAIVEKTRLSKFLRTAERGPRARRQLFKEELPLKHSFKSAALLRTNLYSSDLRRGEDECVISTTSSPRV